MPGSVNQQISRLLAGFNSALTPEKRLLLALSHLDVGDARQAEVLELIGKSINWSVFLRLSEKHGLYPLVCRNLRKLDDAIPPGTIPGSISSALQDKLRNNVVYMTVLTEELLRLTALLDEAHIRTLPWKGPVAALQIYGDILLRTSGDIDLLMASEDIISAVGILVKAGYEIIGYPGNLTHEQLLHIVRHHHHFPLLHNTTTGMHVELHWKITSMFTESELDFNDLWQTSRVITLAGHKFYSMPRETLFISMAVHGSRHCWGQLRWLCDVATLLENKEPLDGEWIIKEAYRLRVLEIIQQTLILANLFFKTPLPEWAKSSLVRSRKAQELVRQAIGIMTDPPKTAPAVLFLKPGRRMNRYRTLYWRKKRYDLALRNTFYRKISYLHLILAPTSESFQCISLPHKLHFLYTPLRLFLWIRRRIIRGE